MTQWDIQASRDYRSKSGQHGGEEVVVFTVVSTLLANFLKVSQDSLVGINGEQA